jgi:hypothetical protein
MSCHHSCSLVPLYAASIAPLGAVFLPSSARVMWQLADYQHDRSTDHLYIIATFSNPIIIHLPCASHFSFMSVILSIAY